MKNINFSEIISPTTLGVVAIGAITGVIAGSATLIAYGLLTTKGGLLAFGAKNTIALKKSSSMSHLLKIAFPASTGVIGGGAAGLGVASKKIKKVTEKFEQQVDEFKQQLQTVEAQINHKTSPTTSDDLEQIRGIGPRFSSLLQSIGIHTIHDLAHKTPEEIRFLLAPSEGVRMFRLEDWIAQAQLVIKANKGSL